MTPDGWRSNAWRSIRRALGRSEVWQAERRKPSDGVFAPKGRSITARGGSPWEKEREIHRPTGAALPSAAPLGRHALSIAGSVPGAAAPGCYRSPLWGEDTPSCGLHRSARQRSDRLLVGAAHEPRILRRLVTHVQIRRLQPLLADPRLQHPVENPSGEHRPLARVRWRPAIHELLGVDGQRLEKRRARRRREPEERRD